MACAVCGKIEAEGQCSRCKKVSYCSRECQTVHWREGGHMAECIGGFIALNKTSSDAERQRQRDLFRARDGTVYGEFVTGDDQERQRQGGRLEQVIRLFSGIADTRAGWHADGTGFFFSLGDNLRRVVQTALIPYEAAKMAFASELERWIAVNPPPPGKKEGKG